MTNQISYRLLTVNDAENYHQIRLECLKNHPESFGGSYEEELNIQATRFIKELTEDKNHSFWYGAFDTNKLIGISGFIQQKRIKTRHRGDLVLACKKSSPGISLACFRSIDDIAAGMILPFSMMFVI